VANPRRTLTALAKPALFVTIFLVAWAFYVSRAVEQTGLRALPEPADGSDYEALAFNIWQYHRFGFDWGDPRWRQPYLGSPEHASMLERPSGYYPTTYKQPAVPLAMAVVAAASGRSFAAWRVVNCAITAGAVTTAAAVAAVFAGWTAAALTAVLVLNLWLPTLFAQQFMTEGLATFLLTLLTWRWIVNGRNGWTRANAVGAGLVLGALVTTRSIFVLYMPLAIVVAGMSCRWGRRCLAHGATCVLAALLIVGPWWVRNTLVLKAFMPLGTQGALNMPAGFGPLALRFEGVWSSNPAPDWEAVEALNLDPVTTEVRVAQIRSRATLEWMRDHPRDVVRLMGLHVWQETRPRTLPYPTDAWLLPAAALAALILRRSPGVGVVAAMTAVNLVGIALTWSVAGRFMAPVQPILAALVGAALVIVARRTAASIFTRLARDPQGVSR
jgi:hypothetical protein